MKSRILTLLVVLAAAAGVGLTRDNAAEGQAGPGEAIADQQALKQDFKNLMDRMVQVADTIESSDADVANRIRQAVKQAQSAFIADDMDRVIELLQQDLIPSADQTQAQVIEELRRMLDVLRSGAVELDKRIERITKWRDMRNKVETLLNKEKTHAADSVMASRGREMAQQLADLGKQLGEIVEKQKDLLAESEKLPAPGKSAEKIIALRNEIDELRKQQGELNAATGGMPISRLPVAEKIQKDHQAKTVEIGEKLQELANDKELAEELKAVAADKEVGKAGQSIAHAGKQMGKAADELGKSNKTAAADPQDQAAADLAAASEALGKALEKIGQSSPSGKLAGKQADLAEQTKNLAEKVKKAVDAATSGDPEAPKPENIEGAGESMKEAAEDLNAQDKDSATEKQEEALKQLTDDKAKLADLRRRVEEKAKNPDLAKMKDEQDKTAEETGDLQKDMNKSGAKDGSPTPGQKSVESAGESMKQASGKLGNSQPGQASQDQQRAVEDLRRAMDELDKAIQREQEMIQAEALVKIDARLRVILREQLDINARTKETYRKRQGDSFDREQRLTLEGLGDRQGKQGEEIKDIVGLVKKEGTTSVFPAVLEQVGKDMSNVQGMLRDYEAGPLTQSAQEQIAATIKDLIDSLQKEIGRRRQGGGGGGSGGGGGGGKPPLVPAVAELKMLRTLQRQINSRTFVLDAEKQSGESSETVILLQHKLLGESQEEVRRLTAELNDKMKQPGPPPGEQGDMQ